MDEQEEYQRGGRGGGNGGEWNRSSKRPKLPKAPPQRGLGVAQLEKILREEQHKIEDNTGSREILGMPSSCLGCSHTHPHQSHSVSCSQAMNTLSSTHSALGHVPMARNFDLVSCRGTSSVGGGGGCDGVYDTGGSAVPLPGHELPKLDSEFAFPIHFSDKFDPVGHSSSPLLQSQHFQHPSSMMNHFSSTSELNIHHVEPPSYQNSLIYSPVWSEERKMDCMKQKCPFSVDDAVPSPFLQMHKPELPCSCNSQSVTNSELSKANFRATKKGIAGCDFLTLGPPAANEELTEFVFLPLQGSKDDPQQWPRSQCDSSHQMLFHNFLPPKRSTEPTSGLDSRRGGAGGKSVDLSLKLSVGSSDEEEKLHLLKKAD